MMHCVMNKNHWEAIFISAFETFKKNKIRSFLTVFGVMIGIGMVIIVLSAGHGLRGIIMEEISSFGDNWIDVEIKVPSTGKASIDNVQGLARGVSITSLTRKDMEAIRDLDNIGNAYAGITTQVVTSYQSEKIRPTVFSVTAEFFEIDKGKPKTGRFFTSSEEKSASQVIVLGAKTAETLFGNEDPSGKQIKVDGKSFEVLGVMESKGSAGFFDMDSLVYIPLKTVQKKIMGVDHVLWIIGQTIDNSIAETTAEEIRWLMRDRHDITDPDKDDFSVTTMTESLEIVGTIILGITWLLIALSAISLLVGGVGIMNVMYVSVAERTFEIGLRKSVGASKKDILHQFLTEAVVITGIGGVVGIFFGVLVSGLIAFGAQYQGLAWTFRISIFSILLSVSFSTAVGLLFGLYPARKAAELDPIDAIRTE